MASVPSLSKFPVPVIKLWSLSHGFSSSSSSSSSFGVVTAKGKGSVFPSSSISRNGKRNPPNNFICRAEKEYKFPDPIPEFADAETEKFQTHLHKKLSKKDMFGDSIHEVVGICTQIFSEFLKAEYGGPGTLLVEPFIDMADTLNERGLPGGPQAARAAVKWAQNHVDKDWKEWNSQTGAKI